MIFFKFAFEAVEKVAQTSFIHAAKHDFASIKVQADDLNVKTI